MPKIGGVKLQGSNKSYISGFAYHFHVIRAGGSRDVDEEESPAKRLRTRRARAGSNY